MKVKGPSPVKEPAEHPEDRAQRLAAEDKAKGLIDSFIELEQANIVKLISTYRDADAEAILAMLREEFWGECV